MLYSFNRSMLQTLHCAIFWNFVCNAFGLPPILSSYKRNLFETSYCADTLETVVYKFCSLFLRHFLSAKPSLCAVCVLARSLPCTTAIDVFSMNSQSEISFNHLRRNCCAWIRQFGARRKQHQRNTVHIFCHNWTLFWQFRNGTTENETNCWKLTRQSDNHK